MANLISQDKRSGREARSAQHLQRFFLDRLRRMVATRQKRARNLKAGHPYLRLLDKAVYSTYCDCLDLGVGREARAILRQAFGGAHRSRSQEKERKKGAV